jgi:signal transduction histidine kinase
MHNLLFFCIFLICTIIAVTVFYYIERQSLIRRLHKERESSLTKGTFVALVSHEFRTPMAIIKASSDLMTKFHGRLAQEDIDDNLKNISDSILRMTKMMDDVLLLGKMQNNQVKFQEKEVDIMTLLHEIIRDVESSSKSRRIVMSSNIQSKCNLPLDPTLIYHVISNLLSNALKYSEEIKKVDLHVNLTDNLLILKVIDHGIGIPKNEIKDLFDLFHRCSNVGNISGIGIGLFMIRQCVELHRGTITLQTSENIGSTFTVSIPVKYQDVLPNEDEQ